MKLVFCTFMAAWLAAAAALAQPEQGEYTIGSQDIVTVTVYDHADLTGKYTVESDGSFTFPLIGRVKASGLTLHQLEDSLKTSLSDGYLKNPQISVSMDEYRSQRVFVMGEVRAPGAYQLTGNMTIIEALAKAGGTTQTAAEEVLIVRPHAAAKGNGPAEGPTLATDSEATVLKTNIRELQSGSLSQNLTLKDGDTIVVNKAQSVYVFGQVRAPGAYPIDRGTTVLQALSLAGGVTDRGSTGRIKIVRTVDGAKKELKVKLTDTVEPGDTLIVAERYF
jgi:polysaccharide export outer membrane protein